MKITSRLEATKLNLKHYFTGVPCVHGHLSTRRLKDRVCMECDKQNKAVLRKEIPEEVRASKRESYQKNKIAACQQKKVYRQANKGKINALVAARKKVVKRRTPAWLTDFDKLKIKCMYSIAAMLTRENKEPWHIDHIIPLQGKMVSGLHVPSNLQVMLGSEYIGKKKKFEVNHA